MAPPAPEPPRVPFRGRSRAVAWAKVLLPLAALALLSTVFLLARDPRGPADLPYAELEALAREPRMDRPRLAGVAEDGTTVALTAERVVLLPGSEGTFGLTEPRLETLGPEGVAATLRAGTGEVDPAARRLRLSGAVEVETSDGWRLSAPELSADLAAGTLAGAEVEGEGPLGRIEAGAMALSRGEGEGARLVFNRGVRVLYQPGDPTEAP